MSDPKRLIIKKNSVERREMEPQLSVNAYNFFVSKLVFGQILTFLSVK